MNNYNIDNPLKTTNLLLVVAIGVGLFSLIKNNKIEEKEKKDD